MHFDIIFLDPVCPTPYDTFSIENGSSGGSETCVVRLSEGLATTGLKVGVIQFHNFPMTVGRKVLYMPGEYLEKVSADYVIHQRIANTLNILPTAKKVLWVHDILGKDLLDPWTPILQEFKPKVVCNSDWHRIRIQQDTEYKAITFIYSPLEDDQYIEAGKRPEYDPHQLIWMSSPNKGLEKALETFQKLRRLDPRFKLLVTNPGYLAGTSISSENVEFKPRMLRSQLRDRQSKSMCLFYPSNFEETLGWVTAESNCMGLPVAGYKIGALPEVVTHELFNDEESLLRGVLNWSSGQRPTINGNEKLRANGRFGVYSQWLTLLNELP